MIGRADALPNTKKPRLFEEKGASNPACGRLRKDPQDPPPVGMIASLLAALAEPQPVGSRASMLSVEGGALEPGGSSRWEMREE